MSEERPVADRIDGVPAPAEHALLVGHEKAAATFRSALGGGRLHHAWLLTGPRGIGKATAAYRMAAEALASGSTTADGALGRQIASGGHPSLLTLTRPWDEKAKRFRNQLPVDEVRRTQAFFGLTAAEGRRVCIVDAADDMNASSANALLKILEEPPARTIFFVIAHAPGRLLPTIRSRCRTLPFAPLEAAQVEEVVTTLLPGMDADAVRRAAAIAAGAPRTALTVLQGDVLDHFARFETLAVAAARGSARWTDVHALAERATARGGDFDTFLDLVFGWIGERLREAADEAGAPRGSLVRWAKLWDDAREARERAAVFNLNRKQVVLDLFDLLCEREGGGASARPPDRSHQPKAR